MKKRTTYLAISGFTICVIAFGIISNNIDKPTNNNPKPKVALLADVKIGTQFWTNKNLNVIKFKDGTTIPFANSATQWQTFSAQGKPACCSVGFNSGNDSKYGKLYNWFAVNDPRGLAPTGYHIPSKNEWVTLINYLQLNEASQKMRATSGWPSGQNGTNVSGFSALPATYTTQSAYIDNVPRTFFWSKTEFEDNTKAAYAVLIEGINSVPYPNGRNKGYGVSVRCIKN